MSDKTVTAANVLASAYAKPPRVLIAGASITAGMPVAEDPADSYKAKLADANSAPLSNVVGIALHAAAANQPIAIVYEDPQFKPGFTPTAGEIVVLSGTAGGVCPAADLASTMYPVVLYVPYDGTYVSLKISRGLTPVA